MAIPSATLHVAEGDHYLTADDRDDFVETLGDACTVVAGRIRSTAPPDPRSVGTLT
jgi:hypothetical protein